MIQTAEELAACARCRRRLCGAVGATQQSLSGAASHKRAGGAGARPEPASRPAPPRALSPTEQAQVREVLNSERFQDLAPREVYAELLDEERYLCSVSTMYRILAENAEVRERRNQLRHPAYDKPELLATGPNQVWSWDITKLRGPSKGVYYYLYVILDIYSRYVVGWMIAEVESAELAEQLIAETCAKQGVQRSATHDPCRPRQPDDRQAGGHLAGRPGRDQEPLPTARLQRQPVLRGAVQDAQVPPGLPGPLRQPGRCPQLGPDVLPLVQPPAPPHRAGLADAGRCARWAGRDRAAAAPGGFAAGVPSPSRTLCEGHTVPSQVARGGLDQSTQVRCSRAGAGAATR